jgi:hypothetical protein
MRSPSGVFRHSEPVNIEIGSTSPDDSLRHWVVYEIDGHLRDIMKA